MLGTIFPCTARLKALFDPNPDCTSTAQAQPVPLQFRLSLKPICRCWQTLCPLLTDILIIRKDIQKEMCPTIRILCVMTCYFLVEQHGNQVCGKALL